ncbi:phosphatase PAP2 family protein [Streptococcus catagoni]|uniref:phosphatase PAP2 family protein n=1 Tax=Streptococcus catagoni TaxID=2654874 RepID=UPI001407764B|nr:phosphatase PAP2 family protein [Streptococcus catagoni]
MKDKQSYLLRSSFALLFFVMIGYTVQFYPESLREFDNGIQTFVRGSLPANVTAFFKFITVFGNVLTQVIVVICSALLFYSLKWKAESFLILINGSLAGILVMVFKFIYQRTRPSLEHIVYAMGYSFPSGHAMGSMIIYGTLLIVLRDRIKNKFWKILCQIGIVVLIFLIGLSRIYLGVHFPSDVLAGFILGFGILNFFYPYYYNKRFEWRFQSKQK